jgi:hypothetical protein
MLEIAYWKPIIQFTEMKQQRLDPASIKAAFLQRLKDDGPHICGQRLSDGIQACLLFKELTDSLSDLESHRVFKTKVLNILNKVGSNI